MTLAAVAVLPSAPLLVPGVAATLPDGVAAVCDAIDAVVERLPDGCTAVVVAAGETWGVHSVARAHLAEIGRADISSDLNLGRSVIDTLTRDLRWPVVPEALPIDLAVLTLLLGQGRPSVAVSVPAGAGFGTLSDGGRRLADALGAGGHDAVVVVSGDLAAGLGERSPLYTVQGAREFDAGVVDAVDRSRLDALERLGPEEAQRVGARGWAPLALLHGVLERSKLGLVRRRYAAPRGVGYLVAHGA